MPLRVPATASTPKIRISAHKCEHLNLDNYPSRFTRAWLLGKPEERMQTVQCVFFLIDYIARNTVATLFHWFVCATNGGVGRGEERRKEGKKERKKERKKKEGMKERKKKKERKSTSLQWSKTPAHLTGRDVQTHMYGKSSITATEVLQHRFTVRLKETSVAVASRAGGGGGGGSGSRRRRG